ncbi:hypothetical protein [Cetobacterium ceti]
MDLKKIIDDNLKDDFYNKYIEDNYGNYDNYFNVKSGRERNILINLYHYINNKSNDSFNFSEILDSVFLENDIKKNILQKEFDYMYYFNIFFNSNMKLKEEITTKLKKYKKKSEEVGNSIQLEDELKNIYEEMDKMLNKGVNNYEKFKDLVTQGKKIAKKLHWKYLPIYKETIIENRGTTPEDDIELYYDHFHTLEDLYEKITKKEQIGQIEKEALEKEYQFKVYSVRWNGYDNYKVKRTIYGWEINNVSTLKDGTKSFFVNLDHDLIFYPEKGVKYALEILWNLADNGSIGNDEIQLKLQEIGDWISDVEKTLRRNQPLWSQYY